MKNLNFIKLFLVAAIFSLAITGTASAGKQDFILVNQTGRDILNVYITPSNSYYWDSDILGRDVLMNGETADIHFSRSETDRYWDLKVDFADGNDFVWTNLDLFAISKIVLKFDGAIVEY